jgi:hypothetical protein
MSFTLNGDGVVISNVTVLGPTPGAPIIVSVIQTDRRTVTISYTAPLYSGADVITQYTAVSSPNNLIGTIFTFISGSIVISGLTVYQSYTFSVYATNSYGNGAVAVSNPIIIYPAEPDAPAITSVSQIGWGANISYTAPSRIGLSAISSYTGISTPGSFTTTDTTLAGSLIIGDNTNKLTLGIPYTFTAHATNSYGSGPESVPSNSLTLTRPTADGPTLLSPIQTDLTTVYLSVVRPTLTSVQAAPTAYSITYTGGSTPSSPTTTRNVFANILACRTATATVESAGPYTLTVGGTAPTPATISYTTVYPYPSSPFIGSFATNFNGSNYLIGPTKLRLINTGPFSIEAWIKPTSTTPGVDQCLLQNRDWNGGNTSGFALYLSTTGKIRLEANNNVWNTFPTVITSNSSLPGPTAYALSLSTVGISGPVNVPLITSGPFTIEAWIKPIVTPTTTFYTIIENSHWDGGSTGGFRVYLTDSLKIQIRIQNGGTDVSSAYPNYTNWSTLTSSASILLGDYTHIVFTRNINNLINIYINGVLDTATMTSAFSLSNIASGTNTGNPGIGTIRIGQNFTDGVGKSYFNGFISNVRVVPGVTVYTGNFTVPSFPLPVTQSASTNISAIGPVIPTNGSSVYFPNATTAYGSYLNIAGTPATLALGAGNFTVEGWIYPSSQLANNIILDWRTADNNTTNIGCPVLIISNNIFVWRVSANGLLTAPTPTSLNVWTHFAVVKNGTTSSLYINGQSVVSATDNITYNIMNFLIGKSFDNNYFHGHMSNIRITKGVAVYTGTFTVPTGPLSATQNADTNISAITGTQCVLLTCRNSGTTNGNIFDDAKANTGGTGFPIGFFNGSVYQPPTITKHFSPFGTQAALLAGQTASASSENSGFAYSLNSNNIQTVLFNNNWYHVAVTRDIYDVIRIFINGVADSATVTYPQSLSLRGTSTTGNPGPTFRIGAIVTDGTASSYYTGLLSDLRIIQGYYRSRNFSVPTGLLNNIETLSNVYPITSITNGSQTVTGISTNEYGDGPSGPATNFLVNNGQIEWRNLGALQTSPNLTYTWTVPDGVTSISAVVIGGGGGRGYSSGTAGAGGGGGGGLSFANFITVTPGEVLTIVVGRAGFNAASGFSGANGGTSSIARASGSIIISATGGTTPSVANTSTGGAGGIGLNGLNAEGETVIGFNGRVGGNGASGGVYGQGGSAATYTATPTTNLIGQDLYGGVTFAGTASIVNGSTTITITSVTQGFIGYGTSLSGTGLPTNAIIISPTGTGIGGVGTYTMQNPAVATSTNVAITSTSGPCGMGGANTVGSISPVGYGAVRIVWPGIFRQYPTTNISTNL